MKNTDIPGWPALEEWFGYSPSFHDAQIVSIDLRRDPEPSFIRIHIWRTNSDVTTDGYYRTDRHILAIFSIK